jgi:hypothetical protein
METMKEIQTPQSNGKAVASLILGIISSTES